MSRKNVEFPKIAVQASIAILSLSVLAACGGGSGTAPALATKTSAVSTYGAGRIAGFGSVVINNTHYDETNAMIVDEDGNVKSAADLKLGMITEVQGTNFNENNNFKSATAQNIVMDSLIRGSIESIDTTAKSIVVLGQTVKLTNTTVFDDTLVGGLSTLKARDVIRVYGTFDTTTGVYTATRIEPQSGAELFSLRGSVASLDAAAKTLTIGGAVIDVSTITVPATVKAGSLVRVKLQTAKVNGKFVAVSVTEGLFNPQNNDHTEVDGSVTAFTSTSMFSIDSVPVDASKATFPDGMSIVKLGAHLEAEGAIVNGTLIATSVKLRTDEMDDSDGFDVDGNITSIDTIKKTIAVHGVTFSYVGAVVYTNGTEADLKLNAKVDVRGSLAADGVTINATAIKFAK